MLSTQLLSREVIPDTDHHVYLAHGPEDISNITSATAEANYLKTNMLANKKLIVLNDYQRMVFVIVLDQEKPKSEQLEALRTQGHQIYSNLKELEIKSIGIKTSIEDDAITLALIEGLLLSSYHYSKFKSAPESYTLDEVKVTAQVSSSKLERCQNLINATCFSRDLINHPHSFLSAEELSTQIQRNGQDFNYDVEVFGLEKIKSLKMGGLLAVNQGSIDPPTFNVLEYKPVGALNKKPYVLVGKGVVYDTGGLSLKPTENSMDLMKCDMAGAATVIGVIQALASNNIPVNVVGLIPATDNRPGGKAVAPGDVISMMSGTTVEVMNTDAEGRLILADALEYAKRYHPELVIDIATLTGSAIRAIGHKAAAMMGNASKEIKSQLEDAGATTHERLFEFPFWNDYNDQLKSDVADLKNIGGATAGAITAGKFLEHFVDYDWIHLDIAGPAFLNAPEAYRGKGGTGFGVRLLYHFFLKQLKNGTEK